MNAAVQNFKLQHTVQTEQTDNAIEALLKRTGGCYAELIDDLFDLTHPTEMKNFFEVIACLKTEPMTPERFEEYKVELLEAIKPIAEHAFWMLQKNYPELEAA